MREKKRKKEKSKAKKKKESVKKIKCLKAFWTERRKQEKSWDKGFVWELYWGRVKG